MKRIVLSIAIAIVLACGAEPIAPLDPPDVPTPATAPAIELHVFTWFSCKWGTQSPLFTFTAAVEPDTLEVRYELLVEIPDLRDRVGTFSDKVLVDWGGPTEQRVEYRLEVAGSSFSGVSRCTVQ